MSHETRSQRTLQRKLHPRTGFMIFVPGFIVLCLFALYVISPNLQAAKNMPEGIFLMLAVNAAVAGSLWWSDLGHTVTWNSDRLSVRPYGEDFLFRRKPVKVVAYASIRGVKLHPSPRGVPPRYPLIEIDALSSTGKTLVVDPYHFTRASMASFVTDLQERVPALQAGDQARIIARLQRLFGQS